jgi:hypothetical protein
MADKVSDILALLEEGKITAAEAQARIRARDRDQTTVGGENGSGAESGYDTNAAPVLS